MENDLEFLIPELQNVTVRSSYEPIPEGVYTMMVANAERRQTKAGTGLMLVLNLDVVDGPYAGRKFWKNINIKNPNPETERRGLEEYVTLTMLCGLDPNNTKSSSMVIGNTFPVKTKVEPRKDNGQLENKLFFNAPKQAANLHVARPSAPQATAAQMQAGVATSAAADNRPVWSRSA